MLLSNDRLYVFIRDPENSKRLVSQGLSERDVMELVRNLAAPDVASAGETASSAEPALAGRIAKVRNTIMRRLRRGQSASTIS